MTLSTHAPLGGKLLYLADTGDDDGVWFIAVECDANVHHLAGDEDHDVLTFMHLVLELDMSLLPAPLLAMLETHLAGGGMALVVSVYHAVTDGPSL
jgi:hypothetical protein